MSYQALYRVWRPQAFQDVIGEEHITKTLQNALLKKKTSHAYLLTGPRGTGKTSVAKIIAKAVNCERAPAAEPCNECAACRGITDGAISDVIEIDAASNSGVHEMRDLRDKVGYAPSSVRYRVYIIDEVHMLSTDAFNALLKTLEEPPAHVMFILATTEPHKVPLTIISRCQRFDFHRIPNSAIVQQLQKIVAADGIGAEEDALKMLAQASEGGMRDAQSLLDQVLSFSDGAISADDVLTVTGSVSTQFLEDVTKAVFDQDTAHGISAVETLISEGKDPVRFLEDLIYYYRDLLLYQTSPDLEKMLERARVDDHFTNLANTMGETDIYRMIGVLNESQQEMKWTNHPRIFLELSVVKMCQGPKEEVKAAAPEAPDTALADRVEKLEGELQQLKKQGVAVSEGSSSQQEKRRKSAGSAGSGMKGDARRIKNLLHHASKQDLQQLKAKWSDVMEKLRTRKISAHACLIDSQPVACSKDTFLLAFKYDIHCQMINENQNREVVEQVVGEVFDTSMDMMVVPDAEWEKVKNAYIEEQHGGSSAEAKKKPEDPLVSEAEQLFGSAFIEIKE